MKSNAFRPPSAALSADRGVVAVQLLRVGVFDTVDASMMGTRLSKCEKVEAKELNFTL